MKHRPLLLPLPQEYLGILRPAAGTWLCTANTFLPSSRVASWALLLPKYFISLPQSTATCQTAIPAILFQLQTTSPSYRESRFIEPNIVGHCWKLLSRVSSTVKRTASTCLISIGHDSISPISLSTSSWIPGEIDKKKTTSIRLTRTKVGGLWIWRTVNGVAVVSTSNTHVGIQKCKQISKKNLAKLETVTRCWLSRRWLCCTRCPTWVPTTQKE